MFSDNDIEHYISTDNLLQDCEGVRPYDGEPNITSAICYKKGDLLLSNIRQYLKKLWLADCDGLCSPDVLVIRVQDSNVLPKYLYTALRRQQFFDYVMQDVKGIKMPRGNKAHILRYEIPNIPLEEQQIIVAEIATYEAEIERATKVMQSCEARKKAVLGSYLN